MGRVFRVHASMAGLFSLVAAAFPLLLAETASAATTTKAGEDYVQECEAAGVPRPPPWNYENAWHGVNSQWTRVPGVLEVSLAGSDNEVPDDPSSRPVFTEVFYYESSAPATAGMCVALPRSVFEFNQVPEDGPPAYIQLLGVICQSQATGKACFWDSGPRYIPGGVSATKTLGFGNGIDSDPVNPDNVTVFAGGASLSDADKCTNCHKGENVFLVHPLTQLGQVSRMPAQWYEPIVKDTWLQNDGPVELSTADTCAGCHTADGFGRFPQLSNQTPDYCEKVLRGTWGLTMPMNAVPFPGGTTEQQLREAYPTFFELDEDCGEAPPLETSPFMAMGSMDGPAERYWTPETGSVSDVTGNVTQGTAAMAINASGYVRVDSLPVNSWGFSAVGSRLDLDVYVPPQGQPNPYWLGAVQLFVTIPSAYMFNAYVGQVELTPGGTGWRTAQFALSQQVQATLRQAHPDVRFALVTNTPQGAPAIVVDHLRFAGTLQEPAPAPQMITQYSFERGMLWGFFDAGVDQTETSGDVAYLGSASLKVDLNTSSDARVWTVPTAALSPGDTVVFRVYVPGGAPVVAIQPFVADNNWAWAENWNTSFPYDGWVTVATTVPEYAAMPVREIGVKFYVDAYYDGPVYIDAVGW